MLSERELVELERVDVATDKMWKADLRSTVAEIRRLRQRLHQWESTFAPIIKAFADLGPYE